MLVTDIEFMLLVVVEVGIVGAMTVFSWYQLAVKILGRRYSRRLGLQFGALFCVLQIMGNYLGYLFGWMGYLPEDGRPRILWSIGIFTIQSVLFVLMLRRENPTRLAKLVSAVALGFFMTHGITEVVARLVFYDLVPWIGGAETLFGMCVREIVWNIGQHTTMVLAMLLFRWLVDKTNFSDFFNGLFTTKGRGYLTTGVCVALMQVFNFILLIDPAIEDMGLYTLMQGVSCLLVFGIFLAAGIFESYRQKVDAQEMLIAQQAAYVSNLEDIQQTVRAFKHDTQNMMSSLYMQAKDGDVQGVQQRVREQLEYFDDTVAEKIRRTGGLTNVEVTELKSFLLVKLAQLQQMGVEYRLEVFYPVKQLWMGTDDFLRCIGILVDNAAEAALEAGKPAVSVLLIAQVDELQLVVENPVKQKPPLHKLGREGYTTKGGTHGNGLAIYKEITGQYRNVVTKTSCTDKSFTQEMRVRR